MPPHGHLRENMKRGREKQGNVKKKEEIYVEN
jgi:hypothetical protein